MSNVRAITPCLWFNSEAERAAHFYVSIFPASRVTHTSRFTDVGKEHHRQPANSVMTVSFELDGQPFVALNGGPMFKFNEAISFQVMCDTQEEVDHFWERLGEGGDPHAQQCGWLKDQFGVSWQVIPRRLLELLNSPDAALARRASEAMFRMKKFDIAELERAAAAHAPA